MLVPHTIRFELLKYHRQFELPDTEEFNVLRQWYEDMIQVRSNHSEFHKITTNLIQRNPTTKVIFVW